MITCPYHAWAFKLDGNLAHARNCENVANFDSDKAQLVPVRLEEYAGFVFINMDPNATSVEDQLPGLGAKVLEACPEVHDLKLAARFTTRTPANWKNIVDNYLECYHCGPAHPGFPTPFRLIVTGTPCTVTGRCNTVSPNRPNSLSNSKRARMRHSTVSGCGRARC